MSQEIPGVQVSINKMGKRMRTSSNSSEFVGLKLNQPKQFVGGMIEEQVSTSDSQISNSRVCETD